MSLNTASTCISTARVLALSGGGANGAYGAGILVGWTKAGANPVDFSAENMGALFDRG